MVFVIPIFFQLVNISTLPFMVLFSLEEVLLTSSPGSKISVCCILETRSPTLELHHNMSSLTLLVSLNNFEIRNVPLKPGSKDEEKIIANPASVKHCN